MDFDEGYIRQLTQKYRIAVAIAVLREKPENLSINDYITELRNKLNDDIDDLDLTICSDDFDLDENIIINDLIHNDGVFDDTNNNNDNLYNDSKGLSNDRCDNDKDIGKDAMENATSSQESLNVLNNIIFASEFEHDNLKHFETNNSLAKEHDYTNVFQKNTAKYPQFNYPGSTFCETNTGVHTNISNSNDLGNAIKQTAIITHEETETNARNEEIIVLANEAIEITNIPIDTYYDSQATEIYSLYGFTENTHYSQSQYDNIVINDKFLKSKNTNIGLKNTSAENNLKIVEASNNQNFISKNEVINTKSCSGVDENKKLNESDIIHTENAEKHQHVSNDQTKDTYETQDMDVDEIFPQCGQDFNNVPIYEDLNVNKISYSDVKQINKETDCRVEENEGKKNSELNEEDSRMQINEEDDNDETQIVSFKVVEELNKIKNYISRRVERRMSNDGSMDSGYRSDSQTRSSGRNSLQQSGNWLNQAAHSLYNYITQCPLLATTQEIVSEIAQVLGQLIDKLQEEENYPSFLEELLENVDFLLRDVTDGCDGEDIILKKDENIQRLLLLNKSAHIQKYTIEKITKILEKLQKNLSNPDETYEITHISEIENMSYVFHILEAILQRYIKVKDVVQEMTNSPNELKKSSISDIWKRKWNPNYKEDSLMQDFSQKKCVLLSCNEVLNKLVVTCMDGYSLIAFSALQCFNLLQL